MNPVEARADQELAKILDLAVTARASDIHLAAGSEPWIRVNEKLQVLAAISVLSQEKILGWMKVLLDKRWELLTERQEFDFSFSWKEVRLRVNIYWQMGEVAVAMRLIPIQVPPLSALGLPPILEQFCALKQGLVLLTGPTGHGKSTTAAAMLDFINKNEARHIVTVEDPVEYGITPKKSIVSQREFLTDTKNWNAALRAVLRQDPDVVFVGEMRDLETISATLTIAETGHLVFSTLHTNSAAQTIDRIVDVFPKGSRDQIAMQLAGSLTAVISQRLLPNTSRGMIPAFEILVATSAVRTAVREGKTHMIDNIIQTSAEVGMMGLEKGLAALVRSGAVKEEIALTYSLKPEEFRRQLRSGV